MDERTVVCNTLSLLTKKNELSTNKECMHDNFNSFQNSKLFLSVSEGYWVYEKHVLELNN